MEKEEILQRLKWQRAELDDLIYGIGGEEHQDFIVRPEIANDMVSSAFRDIEKAIYEGRIIEAHVYALQYKNKKWFEG